ncbi:FAD-dependent oxidoreductase [Bradyrhizobium jicamae]|uniref:FAD-dependent oxidoreductase n=1 Tax=Bradyrhizobium jicamae TaxID=280332 RepID=UPI0024BFEC68|nr:FAD-dependent oxidoreductase [Bradyrhizobium jicamae]
MSEQNTDVAVLGAGIVGVSTAYAARQRGMSVVLIDRREPGSEMAMPASSAAARYRRSIIRRCGSRCRNIWATATQHCAGIRSGQFETRDGSRVFWPIRRPHG